MGSNLSDHQLTIDCYMQMLYTNLVVTTNQKPWGTWLTQLVEHASLDHRVLSSSPMLGTEIT